MEIVQIIIRVNLCYQKTVTSTLLHVSIMYDVTLVLLYNVARSLFSRLPRLSLDRTVSRRARREDLADTLNLPREYSLSRSLTRHSTLKFVTSSTHRKLAKIWQWLAHCPSVQIIGIKIH